jgi:type III secretion protein F
MESLDANDNQAMLKMQFMVGQYNAMLEATSSVTKSLVDESKQMAQRSG